MSIDGKQLPAPPPKFGGVIKRNAAEGAAQQSRERVGNR
jgi:hypothetical protein